MSELNSYLKSQRGFTLIELILVIFIMGIIALGSTVFIVNAAKGLNDVSRRDAIASSLRHSINRINAELANSLAASVRISARTKGDDSYQCVEMMPIIATAFYRQQTNTASTQLTAIALDKNVLGARAVLAKPSAGTFYRDFFAKTPSSVSAPINHQQKDARENSREQTKLSFATASLAVRANRSHNQLLHFIKQPVSYCIQQGNLYRYTNYPLKRKQSTPKNLPDSEPKRTLLAQQLSADSAFHYQPSSAQLTVALTAKSDAEQLTLKQTLWLKHD